MNLLAEIAAYLVAAFLLGLGVGFGLWRLGRRSVPAKDWRNRQGQVAQLTAELAQARASAEGAADTITQLRAEIARLISTVEMARDERSRVVDQLRSSRIELGRAATAHQAALAELAHLQRRVAELSVERARGGEVPDAVRTPPPGPPATVQPAAVEPTRRAEHPDSAGPGPATTRPVRRIGADRPATLSGS